MPVKERGYNYEINGLKRFFHRPKGIRYGNIPEESLTL